MNIDDFVSQNTGYFLLYPGQNETYRGQCVQLTMCYQKQVQGVEPPVYPEAKDYWFRGMEGYSPVNNPQDGDIAVYDGHGVFTEGHIGVVYKGQVFEQNADPLGSPAHLFPRATMYLLGYLRKDNMEPPDYRVNDGDIINIYQGMLGRKPSADEIKIYEGKTYKEMLYAFMGSDEFKNRVDGGLKPTKLSPGVYSV